MQIFDLFDLKRNGVIEFEEFVRSLHIFHPDTPTAEKIACKEISPFLSWWFLCECFRKGLISINYGDKWISSSLLYIFRRSYVYILLLLLISEGIPCSCIQTIWPARHRQHWTWRGWHILYTELIFIEVHTFFQWEYSLKLIINAIEGNGACNPERIGPATYGQTVEIMFVPQKVPRRLFTWPMSVQYWTRVMA
jgi:hypothetical protein